MEFEEYIKTYHVFIVKIRWLDGVSLKRAK